LGNEIGICGDCFCFGYAWLLEHAKGSWMEKFAMPTVLLSYSLSIGKVIAIATLKTGTIANMAKAIIFPLIRSPSPRFVMVIMVERI
jgi:hypothetical protein